ncbi:filamentous hemagglutinin family protein [Acidovorax sp. Be4]|uniref:Filamentous hemagglutinin family protein n=1 Tax=Acidovorax bellezanensis TaxID=2976702 RepID=A0ABT2PS69_9BURK|nr:filamentous haemagglutinin family protein [Acidovorax sp. Be4]MCT9813140.1 filamentous hemagglutinin family protein [Acidovorax sp. Be4]
MTKSPRDRQRFLDSCAPSLFSPLAHAVALLLATTAGAAQAQQAFSPGWFAAKSGVQASAALTGKLPNGLPANPLLTPQGQSAAARAELAQSLANLGRTAQGIAALQAAQASARAAALAAASGIPDGLGEGGLKVDTNSLTAGWINANAPTQNVANGQTTVNVQQTADKAILNWETFNVGKNTTLDVNQQTHWSMLNRVNDPQARPSQIQGQIKADGTVLVVNRNGIIFSGSSQVQTRNLVATAVGMSDAQFKKGLYSEAQGTAQIPTFANDLATTASSFSHGAATGDVVVEAGARLQTRKPVSVTEGGGYVLLLGREARNAGEIITPSGQTVLGAGDAFVIRRGQASDGNQNSSTRGNLVSALRQTSSAAGLAVNTGLIQATTGDVTLTGHDVRQQGVAVATTSVHARGTVHLTNPAGDAEGRVALDAASITAVLLDETAATALDAQRAALIKDSDKAGDGVTHRRDQSLVLIDSAGQVDFRGDSLTLATGGQVLVKAARSDVAGGAILDVSGSVGVRVAMESNNVLINAQGNEQRDAPVNRDDKSLNSKNIWVDRRSLVFVPAGTNGYATDRWYTAGGLLEVGGYLGTTGHGVGEWMAQGGTVQFAGGDVVTHAGSLINLAGGALDVQTGYVNQTYLRGADGRIYNASNAPGDLRYTGLYQGFESAHARWGVTETFANPLIAPGRQLENGYTVGRDAGKLVVATQSATLEGRLDTTVYQGPRQTKARDTALDGYQQAQTAVAQRGQLIVGQWLPIYDADSGNLRYSPGAVVNEIVIGAAQAAEGRIVLDAGWLGAQQLGALHAYALGGITVNEAVTVAQGGSIALHATQVDVNADLTARGGSIALGNLVERFTSASQGWQSGLIAPTVPTGFTPQTTVAGGATLDARGVWSNLEWGDADSSALPYLNGGRIELRSSGDVKIAAGALLDVSSGAALMANGSQRGGKGGNITLIADGFPGVDDVTLGRLVLEGELRGHGVKGGGRLHLQTGEAIVIGGQVVGSDGTLPAGQASLSDLVTQGAFTIEQGAVLPADYHYMRSLAKPGEAIGGAPLVDLNQPGSWITLAADWYAPVPTGNGSYTIVRDNGSQINMYPWLQPTLIPAGTTIRAISNATGFPTSYVVPVDAFPNGIGITPTAGVMAAGTVAPSDVTFSAGTLLRAGTVLPQAVAVAPLLHLGADLFRQGFAQYEVVGVGGLTVAEGADLAVRMPQLRLDKRVAQDLATGADLSAALAVEELPLFAENARTASLTQRAGASLTLQSGRVGQALAPTLTVAAGARISVDPGQRIALAGNGQITLDGALHAAGGRIGVQSLGYGNDEVGSVKGHDRSVWIGAQAVLDVAGISHTAIDTRGRRYGLVQDGGSIQIGGTYRAGATQADAIDNFIVVRPGARLDASGTAAVLDLPQQGATAVASHGGLIHLSSFNGLYLDGDMRAAAGGAGAGGGTLALTLETPNYAASAGPDVRVLVHRELALVREQTPEALAAGLQPGQPDAALVYGHARLGADRVKAGGFDHLGLLVNGVITLENGLDLALGQSLRLTSGSLSLPQGVDAGAQVRLAAPYVRLAGATHAQKDFHVMPTLKASSQGTPGLVTVAAQSQLQVDSSLLDVLDVVGFGARGYVQPTAGQPLVERPGFDRVELRSQGDLRFLPSSRGAAFDSSLTTVGDLVLAASQVYPATGARGVVIAGQMGAIDQWGNFQVLADPQRSLRIERSGAAELPLPYSVFGSLQLLSANVAQGGVVRAPLGTITVGTGSGVNLPTTRVQLLPGSITSVSAAGLVMPYGGTVDNLTYNYNGLDVPYYGLGDMLGSVRLAATHIDVQAGATLDLSGGGELKGAGFLSGRGGSTDARLHPLVQVAKGGFVLPGLATNPVYAIVPGVQPGAAPVAAEKGAGDPMVGRQISIGEGVPGLAAGTYTLLPSTYALMPGAFRVELNGLAASQGAFGGTSLMPNGSYGTAARLGMAHTGIVDAMTTQAVLTPADMLRSYSQYNETSYAKFGLDWAMRDNVPRPQLERDARVLTLLPGEQLQIAPGTVRFAAAEGGRGGTVSLKASRIEVLADGAAPTEGYGGISVAAGTLNNIGAAVIAIGGLPTSTFSANAGYGSTQNAWQVSLGNNWEVASEIVLRKGAVLSAAQVLLVTGRMDGGITVEQGAGIDTLGRGAAAWSGADGYVLAPGATSMLALGNGRIDVLAPKAGDAGSRTGPGYIHIGVCDVGALCSGETRLYAEGSITAVTDQSFLLADSVRYGARDLVLAVGAINVGNQAQLAAAGAAGLLPSGLTLNQQVLDNLLRGDTSTGAPALENLVLTARDSVNFFGTVNLSTVNATTGKSALERLVLGAPAIYGHGGASDVARIATDTLVWNGALTPAGAVMTGGAGTGSGRFEVDARQIEFGWGPRSQPDSVNSHDRLVLGFASVDLNASERITANHKGSLSVYQQQGAWDADAKTFSYSGGDLHLRTPLLTGQAGSVNAIKAGGAITATAPAGAASPLADNATLADALGATLSLDAGRQLTVDTAVLLPSGKLTLSATDNVLLADGAQLDLAGRKIAFFDVNQYSWGGEVTLDSRAGNVTQGAASRIDISAEKNRAGRLTAIALDGTLDLGGAIDGSTSGHYDAGGTQVPFAAGTVDLRGLGITDFVGLNQRLTAGGVFGGRSFQLKQGNLVVGDELKAREINISVDHGSLTVNGRIDASGEQAGSIRLAANAGVTIAGGAVLDARASVLRRDSYGQVIEAPNRAVIEIDAGDGRLVLAPGATMHLDVAGAGANYGTVALNAPRLGGAMGNDVDIDASGAVSITGARSIAVNAFHRYENAPTGTETTADGRPYQYIDQDWLNDRHAESAVFMGHALANGALMNGKLAGLRSYTDQFHLRPGVEVATTGDLHVDGDIDLSGHRYASVNPHAQRTGQHGSGEAGALVLRAAGNLEIFGSVSDGFDGSLLGASPDDKGWILPAGRMPFGGDLIIPHAGLATLDAGTVFKSGRTLNYDLPVAGLTLPEGTALPVAMPLGQDLLLAAGTVLTADVRAADGTLLHAAGSMLRAPLQLAAGQQLGAGFRLTARTQLAATFWPAGVALPMNLTLSQPLALAKGAIVPSETDVVLPGGAVMVNLRPADAQGSQGRTWALAPMLPAGFQSSDLRLVAGADLAAADSRATLPGSTARLQLADTHFGLGSVLEKTYQIPLDVDPGFIEMMGYNGFDWQPGMLLTPAIEQQLKDLYLISQSMDELNQYGFGNVADFLSAETVMKPARQQLFSVLRTGTGDLDLISAGDLDMRTPFGVYTAGTRSASLGAAYNQARARLADSSILQPEGAAFEALVDGGTDSLYAAWYPEQGGNVLVRAGGDLKGDLIGNNNSLNDYGYTFANTRQQHASTAVGNWLWRQGTGSVEQGADAVPTAWWINFGTYVAGSGSPNPDPYGTYLFGNDPSLVGFTGVGTLGGGNLRVEAGGNAGMMDMRGSGQRNAAGQLTDGASHSPRSQGLHLVVASTGRVTADGTLVQTGGGDLDLRLGGALNPDATLRRNEHDLNSTFVNMRGSLHIDAGAIGGMQPRYGVLNHIDTRTGDPFAAGAALAGGGPILVLGDSTVRIETRGDLVLGGVADPGRTLALESTPFTYQGTRHAGHGWSSFSMWTPATAIDLLSAGGNLTPTTAWAEGGGNEDVRWSVDGRNQSANEDGYFYPSILRAAAANGSLYYGVSTTTLTNSFGQTPLRVAFGVTLAPSPTDAQFVNATGKGELQLLAGDSIFGSGFMFSASTADPAALSSVFRPGFVGRVADTGGGQYGWDPLWVHNTAAEMADRNSWISRDGGRANVAPLFTFGSTATSGYATVGQQPARYYAVDGDIVGLRVGQEVLLGYPAGAAGSRHEASMPVAIRAGRDITDSGTQLGRKDTVTGRKTSVADTRGNLIAHAFDDDVSVVEAGRDIRYSSFYVTGPGLLDVSAGRNIYLADKGEFKSLGAITDAAPGDRSNGASIAVAAGMGAGAHWDAFAARYLDPARLARSDLPFADQPGSALYSYGGDLTLAQWLARELGYDATRHGTPEAFMAARQTEFDSAHATALAEGRTTVNRSLAREYKVESRLHLVNWLSERFGGDNRLGLRFDAASMDARSFFAALPAEQQQAFLRGVYYAELKAGGREYNDVAGKRYGSYLRGREAIATLLPTQDAQGKALKYEGDLTMFSSALYFNADYVNNSVGQARPKPGVKYLSYAEWVALGQPGYGVSFYNVLDAGIHTNFGGDISIMTPGGRTLVGVDGGFVPGPGSGVMTLGEGDIHLYAKGDILMGQSRIFTTFGGSILAWSAEGDINAGRGSKTTVVATPQRRVYDSIGNVSLSPSTPSTGAGIATLNPIPEIPPGDIDLIAPLGTIDAGEAGIRVSGNVNLAAMQVVNAENIQVQGKAVGIPVVAAVNVGALTNASAATAQATVAAQEVMQRERAAARQALPSVFTVRVLGFGDQPAEGATSASPSAAAPMPAEHTRYDASSPFQLIGHGALTPEQAKGLTERERQALLASR